MVDSSRGGEASIYICMNVYNYLELTMFIIGVLGDKMFKKFENDLLWIRKRRNLLQKL